MVSLAGGVMERRGHQSDVVRLPIHIPVTFSNEAVNGSGVAINVSEHGLCLRTSTVLRNGQVIGMDLECQDIPNVRVEGEVRWLIELSPLLQPFFPLEVGIKIRSSEPYSELVHSEKNRFVDYRNSPRFTNVLRCQVSGPGIWETTFATNLGKRGLFIRTAQDVEPGALLEVNIFLPNDPKPVGIRCEVVHRLDPSMASEVGSEPGVGVRVQSLSDDARARFKGFIDDIQERHWV